MQSFDPRWTAFKNSVHDKAMPIRVHVVAIALSIEFGLLAPLA
jgi:hypothetical protein